MYCNVSLENTMLLIFKIISFLKLLKCDTFFWCLDNNLMYCSPRVYGCSWNLDLVCKMQKQNREKISINIFIFHTGFLLSVSYIKCQLLFCVQHSERLF